MRQLFYIALHYLRTTYQNRSVLIFSLIMPLVFTVVLGSVIGDFDADKFEGWPVAVVNQDAGELGAVLVNQLAANADLQVSSLDEAEAIAKTEAEDYVAAVVIPADFSQTLLAEGEPDIAFYAGRTSPRPAQTVEQGVQAAAARTAGLVQAARTSVAIARRFDLFSQSGHSADAYFADALARVQQQWTKTAPLAVVSEPVTLLKDARQIPKGMEQSSAGMLVTFALVSILNGAGALILERQQGTLRRLLVLPIGKWNILGGKLLAIFVAGMIQAAILIAVGQAAFGVNWGQAPLALLAVLSTFIFAITGLGMMVAGVARSYTQASALANIPMYSIAALGGAWWQIEITPQWMQRFAQITPTYWAMQGFHDIISRGLGLHAVLPEAGALLAFGALFLSIGVWRFRYE